MKKMINGSNRIRNACDLLIYVPVEAASLYSCHSEEVVVSLKRKRLAPQQRGLEDLSQKDGLIW